MCSTIGLGARLTVPVNGQNKTKFTSLQEAQDAAKTHTGNEAIVRNDDGSYSLHAITNNPNQEKQVIEMAKKGEVSNFDPKIVEFRLSGTFWDSSVKVENSRGEIKDNADVGSQIRGTYLEGSKTGKNEFSNEEDAIAAAQMHDGIEAVVKTKDASGKDVYKLYRASEADIEQLKLKFQSNPAYESKVTTFVVPTSFDIPFMGSPLKFESRKTIDEIKKSAGVTTPSATTESPATATPPETTAASQTQPAATTDNTPAPVLTAPLSQEPIITPPTGSLLGDEFKLRTIGSTDPLNNAMAAIVSAPSNSLNTSLLSGTPKLSLSPEFSAGLGPIAGPYSPYDPFKTNFGLLDDLSFPDFSYDPFMFDLISFPGSDLGAEAPAGTTGTVGSTPTPAPTGSLSAEDQKKLDFAKKINDVNKNYTNNLDNNFKVDKNNLSDAQKMLDTINESDSKNAQVFEQRTSELLNSSKNMFTSEIGNLFSNQNLTMNDINPSFRKYATKEVTSADGTKSTVPMSDAELKQAVDNALANLKAGGKPTPRELLLLAGASESIIKNNPNLDAATKSKLQAIASNGAQLKIEMDVADMNKAQNRAMRDNLKQQIDQLEKDGKGDSVLATQLRAQLANLETQEEFSGNDSRDPERGAVATAQTSVDQMTTRMARKNHREAMKDANEALAILRNTSIPMSERLKQLEDKFGAGSNIIKSLLGNNGGRIDSQMVNSAIESIERFKSTLSSKGEESHDRDTRDIRNNRAYQETANKGDQQFYDKFAKTASDVNDLIKARINGSHCPLNAMMASIVSAELAPADPYSLPDPEEQGESYSDVGDTINNEVKAHEERAQQLEAQLADIDNIDISAANVSDLLRKFREIIINLDVETANIKKAVSGRTRIDTKFSDLLKENRSRWNQLDEMKKELLTHFKSSSEVQKPALPDSAKKVFDQLEVAKKRNLAISDKLEAAIDKYNSTIDSGKKPSAQEAAELLKLVDAFKMSNRETERLMSNGIDVFKSLKTKA